MLSFLLNYLNREIQLTAASKKPILSRPYTTPRRPKYPFVFDSLSEAQQTPAFLANVKVS